MVRFWRILWNWSMVFWSWSGVFRSRSMIFRSWSMIFRSWSMIFRSWSFVLWFGLMFINWNNLFFINGNLHWLGNRNRIGNLYWYWYFYVFFTNLLNNFRTLFFVVIFLNNLVLSLTLLLKSLNTFLLGNVDGGGVTLSLHSGPNHC